MAGLPAFIQGMFLMLKDGTITVVMQCEGSSVKSFIYRLPTKNGSGQAKKKENKYECIALGPHILYYGSNSPDRSGDDKRPGIIGYIFLLVLLRKTSTRRHSFCTDKELVAEY